MPSELARRRSSALDTRRPLAAARVRPRFFFAAFGPPLHFWRNSRGTPTDGTGMKVDFPKVGGLPGDFAADEARGPADVRRGETSSAPRRASVGAATETTVDGIGGSGVDGASNVEQRVAQATEHLVGRLSPSDLAFIRDALRDHLEADPPAHDLVPHVAGRGLAG